MPSRSIQALSTPASRVARPPARMPSVTCAAGIEAAIESSSCPAGADTLALLSPLPVADEAALLRPLPLGQHVLLAFVRIGAFLEDETHRRTDELEALAEEVL